MTEFKVLDELSLQGTISNRYDHENFIIQVYFGLAGHIDRVIPNNVLITI